MSERSYDAVVVGAGVFGAWTAYQLQRSGRRVLLIDAHGPGNDLSSSGDESRIIRMGYGGDEIYTRSAWHSLQLWKEFFARCDEPLFHQTGVLWLAHEGDPYPTRTAQTLQRLRIPFERLTTANVVDRYPQIGLDQIEWAMFEPESGALIARRAVQAVAHEAIKNGVEYFQDAVATPRGSGSLKEIALASGRRISAATFVFACGPWLPKLFPDLLSGRIQPTRQEVFYFGAPVGDQSFSPTSMPIWIDFKGEAYGFPDLEGRGVKVAIDRHGPSFDPDSGDRIASEAGLAEVREYLARRLPALKDAPLLESRVCQYENTSNGDFLIDRHPEFENVWLVGGGSGHGFKHGPAVGEYVAARIKGAGEDVASRFCLDAHPGKRQRTVF